MFPAAIPGGDIEQGSRLVSVIESLLPVLDSDLDGYESSGSHHPSREVFMGDTGVEAVDDDNIMSTPIMAQTMDHLEATRLRLAAEQEWLAKQQAALDRQGEANSVTIPCGAEGAMSTTRCLCTRIESRYSRHPIPTSSPPQWQRKPSNSPRELRVMMNSSESRS